GTLMLIQADATANTGIGAGQVFENDVALTRMWAAGAPGEDGLVPVAAAMELLPATLPLKHPIPIVLTLPAGMSPARVGIYHRTAREGPWDFVSERFDSSAHAFTGEAATAGEFGLLRDDTPPAVRVRPPARRAPAGPYPRWELAAEVRERGSGVAARASHFRVDGVQVPTEWDEARQLLRWRPLAPPAPGRHAWELVVEDHAGLRTVRSGSFVLDSAGHR
ncbi:MAG TPA: hypothetical protein VGU27_05795, partial [Candidatus Eisenbacteria bacterium]|nr:hypothetical protein [Candidatus Eisenbacteria bacterium]